MTLQPANMPSHTHTLPASPGTATKTGAPSPTSFLGATGTRGDAVNVYINAVGQSTTSVNMLPTAVGPAGGLPSGPSAGSTVPHNNMGPFVVINFCIALTGTFPPRP